MAINNDTATVSVEINSEQAKAKLDQLRRDTKKFTDALEEARRTGDKVGDVRSQPPFTGLFRICTGCY